MLAMLNCHPVLPESGHELYKTKCQIELLHQSLQRQIIESSISTSSHGNSSSMFIIFMIFYQLQKSSDVGGTCWVGFLEVT